MAFRVLINTNDRFGFPIFCRLMALPTLMRISILTLRLDETGCTSHMNMAIYTSSLHHNTFLARIPRSGLH